MKTPALAKPILGAFFTLFALFGGGIATSSFAGPERLPDVSKESVVMPICDPRWYVSIGGSVDYRFGDFNNAVHDSFTFDSSDQDDTDGDDDFDIDIDVRSRDWDDTHDNWWNVEGEVGYVLTNHIELFGKFTYTEGGSQLVQGSTIFIDPPSFFNFGVPFDLEFVSEYGDYESWGGELGARYFFLSKDAKIRPYVQISGGAAHVDDIGLRADSELLGDNITFYDGPFYDESFIFTGSALLGIEFNATCHVSVGFNAGVRYHSELDGDDSGFVSSSSSPTLNGSLNGTLNGTLNGSTQAIESEILSRLRRMNNDGGDGFSIPVSAYVKLRF